MKNKNTAPRQQTHAQQEPHGHTVPNSTEGVGHHQPNAADAAQTSDADKAETAKYRHLQKRIMVLSIIFSGLLLIATSVYAYFAWGQWRSMDNSLIEIRQNRELEYRA